MILGFGNLRFLRLSDQTDLPVQGVPEGLETVEVAEGGSLREWVTSGPLEEALLPPLGVAKPLL